MMLFMSNVTQIISVDSFSFLKYHENPFNRIYKKKTFVNIGFVY